MGETISIYYKGERCAKRKARCGFVKTHTAADADAKNIVSAVATGGSAGAAPLGADCDSIMRETIVAA